MSGAGGEQAGLATASGVHPGALPTVSSSAQQQQQQQQQQQLHTGRSLGLPADGRSGLAPPSAATCAASLAAAPREGEWTASARH